MRVSLYGMAMRFRSFLFYQLKHTHPVRCYMVKEYLIVLAKLLLFTSRLREMAPLAKPLSDFAQYATNRSHAMINAPHLLWIIPISAWFGFAVCAMLAVGKSDKEDNP